MNKVIAVLGIDLAKNVFQICAANAKGERIYNRQVSRAKLLSTLANIPPCLVGMEACSSSHYWAREIEALGHRVKLMPPQYVKPYVKTNKNDASDADAICEAVTRPNMRFVAIKTPEQQALMLLHRDRKGLVKERTALVNRFRAVLSEFGVIAPAGLNCLRAWLSRDYGATEHRLPALIKRHLIGMIARLRETDNQILALEKEIHSSTTDSDLCKTLREVPGIGPLTASAIVASVGDVKAFQSGRKFAACYILGNAGALLQTNDGAGDVACKVSFVRTGNVTSFSAGDGSIDSSAEFNALQAGINLVNDINWCGSLNPNVIGCANTPGNRIAVVDHWLNDILWAHELGHNYGIVHKTGVDLVMAPTIGSSHVKITHQQCINFRGD